MLAAAATEQLRRALTRRAAGAPAWLDPATAPQYGTWLVALSGPGWLRASRVSGRDQALRTLADELARRDVPPALIGAFQQQVRDLGTLAQADVIGGDQIDMCVVPLEQIAAQARQDALNAPAGTRPQSMTGDPLLDAYAEQFNQALTERP